MHARKWLELVRAVLVTGCAVAAAPAWGCRDDDASFDTGRGAAAGAAGMAAGDGLNGDGLNGDGDPIDLTDDEIAGVILAANGAEIVQGELALEQAAAPGVRAFATRMVLDHAAANRSLSSLIESTSLEWNVSALASRLTADAIETTEALRALSGPAFDLAYMRAQRMFHARVLSTIDSALVPSVVSPLLEAQLLALRAAITTHLLEADTLLDGLSADGG